MCIRDRHEGNKPKGHRFGKLFTRTLRVDFWSDQGVERATLLEDIINQLQEKKFFVNIQNGWKSWDFRVQQGLWVWCYVYSATEIHGGWERLIRIKLKLRPSGLAQVVMALWAALFLAVLACSSILPLSIVILAGILMAIAFSAQLAVMLRLAEAAVMTSVERLGMKTV